MEPRALAPWHVPGMVLSATRNSVSEGAAAARRLVEYSGLEGCLPVCLGSKGAQEVPEICLGKQDLRVHQPTLWSLQCTKSVHKAPSPSHGTSKKTGTQIGNLSGQSAAAGPGERTINVPGSSDCRSVGAAGVYGELGEIPVDPNSTGHLFGIHSGLTQLMELHLP